MSWIDNIPADVAQLVLDAGTAIARAAWHKINGDPTDDDKAALAAIRNRALLALTDAAEREARALRDGVELGIALEKLAHSAVGIAASLEAAAKRGADRIDDEARSRVETEIVDKI